MHTRKSAGIRTPATASPPGQTAPVERRDPAAVALGDRIRLARDALRLKQADLAEHIGGHVNTVSKWERGLSVPSALELERVARALRTTVGDLLAQDRGATFHRPPQGEDSLTLDTALLAETLTAVADGLDRKGIKLPAPALAELVALIYEQEAVLRARAPGSSGDVVGTATRMLRLVKAG